MVCSIVAIWLAGLDVGDDVRRDSCIRVTLEEEGDGYGEWEEDFYHDPLVLSDAVEDVYGISPAVGMVV